MGGVDAHHGEARPLGRHGADAEVPDDLQDPLLRHGLHREPVLVFFHVAWSLQGAAGGPVDADAGLAGAGAGEAQLHGGDSPVALHHVRHAGVVVVLHVHDVPGPLVPAELRVVDDDLALRHGGGAAHGDALEAHESVGAGLAGGDVVRMSRGGTEHVVAVDHVPHPERGEKMGKLLKGVDWHDDPPFPLVFPVAPTIHPFGREEKEELRMEEGNTDWHKEPAMV